MRKINKIIIHCSATREGENISAATIDRWHRDRGWRGIGYHYVVSLNGNIEYGRPIDESGAHTKNHNKGSVGICYIGGLDEFLDPKDTRTLEQKESLLDLIKTLKRLNPGATVHGHNEFAAKACPCFNVEEEYCNL